MNVATTLAARGNVGGLMLFDGRAIWKRVQATRGRRAERLPAGRERVVRGDPAARGKPK